MSDVRTAKGHGVPLNYLTPEAVERRARWIDEIANIGAHFGQDTARVQQEVTEEIEAEGPSVLCDHLRLAGAIPESYRHDSSEEKLYSKYTDILIHLAFYSLGLTSVVLTERADAADVEVVGDDFSFVADAKAFRLSRTAKNQKDFKVQAMDTWKRGKPFATVICPLYQLPSRTSQIYNQAITRSVCILSYDHLCVLVRIASSVSLTSAQELLHRVFQCVETLNPSKDAVAYWTSLNRLILDHCDGAREIWRDEKLAAEDAVVIAKQEALEYLARERERIMRLSREDAIQSLLDQSKIESRERVITSVSDNGLFALT